MIPIEEHLARYTEYLTMLNSPKGTLRSYVSTLKKYLEYCMSKYHQNPFQEELVRDYILYRYSQGLDWKTINSDYSSLKKYFTAVLKKEWSVENLPRPKMETELPNVISIEEVERLIDSCCKFKYKVLMIFLYATGMRLSEALGVRVKDIDTNRLTIKVNGGKGKKDRFVDVPIKLIEVLREYYKLYRPVDRLFYGNSPEIGMKHRTVQSQILKSKQRAKILHDVSPHTLRHCYATHHMENGTNIVYLQKMLGHKNLKTTSIYLHLCVNYPENTIKHPLLNMKLDLMKNIKI